MTIMTPIHTNYRHGSYTPSFTSSSPLAEAAIAHDLAEHIDEDLPPINGDQLEAFTACENSFLATTPRSSYHAPGFFTGSRDTIVSPPFEQSSLNRQEKHRAFPEERDLPSDSNIIHCPQLWAANNRPRKLNGMLSRTTSFTNEENSADEDTAINSINGSRPQYESISTDTTPLLRSINDVEAIDPTAVEREWKEVMATGFTKTTWQREAKVIGKYSAPLMVTFLLQYSLTVASIFAVGHLGKIQLGAVSLASMTTNITGVAVYQGLATSLDTLCAQAYGSGRKKLVGLQMQRMVYFLFVVTIPIAILWIYAKNILIRITPEKEVAILAGQYLKVVVFGAPGYACFESGKRFLQAQGIFTASLYVLLFCAPLNAFMNWYFVWKLEWGFIGSAVAVAITHNLLPFCLFLYVYFVAGYECWNGFTRRALQNWGPMIRLALPGFLMVEAEYLAFEILTLASSYLGTTALASQSVLCTIASITFQLPFPLSIAGSTRVANLIGATLADAARTATKVTLTGAAIVGLLNVIGLFVLRSHIPLLFTSDEGVIEMVSQILPFCAAFQLVDALTTNCNGILRGLGRQMIGGYIQVFCYYCIAMPISMGTAFGLGWGLPGLWVGIAIALSLVLCIEALYIKSISFQSTVEEARKRNSMI
ncbi:MatE domain containing protein [Elaphomyces granulatus]